jgi:hypothetical protein
MDYGPRHDAPQQPKHADDPIAPDSGSEVTSDQTTRGGQDRTSLSSPLPSLGMAKLGGRLGGLPARIGAAILAALAALVGVVQCDVQSTVEQADERTESSDLSQPPPDPPDAGSPDIDRSEPNREPR